MPIGGALAQVIEFQAIRIDRNTEIERDSHTSEKVTPILAESFSRCGRAVGSLKARRDDGDCPDLPAALLSRAWP